MAISRRHFLATSSLVLAGAPVARLGAQQAPAPPAVTPRFDPVRRDVGTFFGRGGTIGWLVTPTGVVVVDSQFPDTAQMFVDGMKSRTTRPYDLLINSHHHGDHTGGNQVIRPLAGKIVAQRRVPDLQRTAAQTANTLAAQAYPDTLFDTTWRQDMGSEVVSAKYYGPAHTGGDIVVFFERANVAHTGDLMSFNRSPRADRPAGASVRNWISVLEAIVKDHGNDTVYIFGHSKMGERLTGSNRDLLAMRDYLTAVVTFAQREIVAGKSRDEVSAAKAIPGFESYEGLPSFVLQATYDELTATP